MKISHELYPHYLKYDLQLFLNHITVQNGSTLNQFYLFLFQLKSSNLKVVHVVEALAGGVHTYFKDLSFFFGDPEINKTVNTTIIYSGNRKEIDSEKIKEEFSNGVSLIELSMVRDFSPIQDLKSILELTAALRKLNPDVIHLHSSKAGVLGRIACFLIIQKNKNIL